MPTKLLSSSIPNLVNGVSQQPAALRLASQSLKEVNRMPSVVDGNKRRTPTEQIAKLGTASLDDAYIHPINRDTNERYVMVIGSGGTLTVNDIDGTAKPVTITNGSSYINTASPSDDLRCVSIADFTFIVNRSVSPAMSTDLSPNSTGEGLVHVAEAAYSVDYNVFIDEVQQATYATVSSGTLSAQTVAEELATQLTTNLSGSYTVTQDATTIHIVKNDGTDFALRVTDSKGGGKLMRVKGSISKFADLPATAPHGFIVKVTGDGEASEDDYYVKFVTDNEEQVGSPGFDEGRWEETVAPDSQFKLDKSTMPHALVRQANGTFVLDEVNWAERTAGDSISNADPSFVGLKISDVFLFKNRLGFLSDDKVIMSQPAGFFNFFRSTATTILDTDPIDVAVSSSQVSLLRYAVPYDQSLLLFSDHVQFRLQGGDTLTSRTVSVVPTTHYEASKKVAPVPMGTSVFFVSDRGNHTSVREYFVDSQTTGDDAAEITAQVPRYIPSNQKTMAGSPNNGLLCMADGTDDRVYIYRYYYAGSEKLQSAWCRWELGSDATVHSVTFIESTLYLVVSYADGYYLQSMQVQDGYADSDIGDDTDDPGRMVYHLDRRITEADCLSITYDSSTRLSTFTLPYDTSADQTYAIVTREADGQSQGVLAQGMERVSANVLRVKGDWTSRSVFIGQSYTSTYQFSPFYVREQRGAGGQLVIQEGRLILNHLTLSHNSAGFYEVTVDPTHGSATSYEFTGRVTSSPFNIIDRVSLETGEFRVPAMAEASKVAITVSTDSFLPATLTGAEWEARLTIRSRR